MGGAMNEMTIVERIVEVLKAQGPLCDICIHHRIGSKRRQQVNTVARRHVDRVHTLSSSGMLCAGCGKANKLRTIQASETREPLPCPQVPRAKKVHDTKGPSLVHREQYLAERFNHSMSVALQLPVHDYYKELTLEGLLELKSGYARINELVTMKLTECLLSWVSEKMNLTLSQRQAIYEQVMAAKASSGGFDLDFADAEAGISFIAEVKANIPVNRGTKFEAKQIEGLDNDVLTMLGQERRDGKGRNKKLKNRDTRSDLKFLALLDLNEVRIATNGWKKSLERSPAWRPAAELGYKILFAEEVTEFIPGAVHVVFLTLI